MKKACVIGWPIAHSRSPLIHGHWLDKYGIRGVYEKHAVKPQELDEFLAGLIAAGYSGCNVTVPHKQAVFEAVASADDATRRLKAVNTVFARDGALFGTNTDGEGFLAHLKASCPDWSATRGPVAVLGAGGAARAIAGALLDAGVPEIRLFNRTQERSRELASDIGGAIDCRSWSDRHLGLEGTGLLVNTTTLGMKGSAPLTIDLDRLSPHAPVYDIVYSPLMTELLKRAQAKGNPVVDGLGMLLHQAVRGFELWFGVRPEVTEELRALIVSDIEASL